MSMFSNGYKFTQVPDIRGDLLKKARIDDTGALLKRYAELYARWCDEDSILRDSELVRHFSSILSKCTADPIYVALLGDSKAAFEELVTPKIKHPTDLELYISDACFLGSQAVCEWIFNKLNYDIPNLDPKIQADILSMIAVSGNCTWVGHFYKQTELTEVPPEANRYQRHCFHSVQDLILASRFVSPDK